MKVAVIVWQGDVNGLQQNGLEKPISGLANGMVELNFEEDEDDAFLMKDLPPYACA